MKSARATLATLSTLCACLGAALLIVAATTVGDLSYITANLSIPFLSTAGAMLAGLLVLRGLERP